MEMRAGDANGGCAEFRLIDRERIEACSLKHSIAEGLSFWRQLFANTQIDGGR